MSVKVVDVNIECGGCTFAGCVEVAEDCGGYKEGVVVVVVVVVLTLIVDGLNGVMLAVGVGCMLGVVGLDVIVLALVGTLEVTTFEDFAVDVFIVGVMLGLGVVVVVVVVVVVLLVIVGLKDVGGTWERGTVIRNVDVRDVAKNK